MSSITQSAPFEPVELLNILNVIEGVVVTNLKPYKRQLGSPSGRLPEVYVARTFSSSSYNLNIRFVLSPEYIAAGVITDTAQRENDNSAPGHKSSNVTSKINPLNRSALIKRQ